MKILSIEKVEHKGEALIDWYHVEACSEGHTYMVNIPIEPNALSPDELREEIMERAKREIHIHWDLISAHHGNIC